MAQYYVIQLGADFANYEGATLFTKEDAEALQLQIMSGLHEQVKTGATKIELKEIWEMLTNMRIMPYYQH